MLLLSLLLYSFKNIYIINKIICDYVREAFFPLRNPLGFCPSCLKVGGVDLQCTCTYIYNDKMLMMVANAYYVMAMRFVMVAMVHSEWTTNRYRGVARNMQIRITFVVVRETRGPFLFLFCMQPTLEQDATHKTRLFLCKSHYLKNTIEGWF